MGSIFISHSSRNAARAVEMRDWLRDHGWSDVFLDLDPERGLVAGKKWQEELKAAGERCAAVIFLLSPDWAASRWCQTELLVAVQLGKLIFGVPVEPTPFADLPVELTAHFQLADVSDPARAADGYARLAIGLQHAGLQPDDFPWPPPQEPGRSPYRGLFALEEQDAAIFFGRDAPITHGLDALRRMRAGSPERLLVVLGASGAGKSSFLKAGLLPRLRRDEANFLVLPTFRPERAALAGPQGLLAALGLAAAPPIAGLTARLAALRAPVIARLARYGAAPPGATPPPTVVLPIDQAEELFAAENSEGPAALELLRDLFLADAGLVAVCTLRSDRFDLLQGEPRLADLRRLPFDLPRLPPSSYREVIEGPGRLAAPPVTVAPELTARLAEQLDAPDALPLLAFTLERLHALYGSRGQLTLEDYEEGLGGLAGAIGRAAAAALAAALGDPALPSSPAALEGLARQAFVPWLVRVEAADAPPQRRVARRAELPAEALPLVRHWVDQRLLVEDARGGEATVEVSHEAVLRHWKTLAGWIAEERDHLRALEGVLAAAADWPAEDAAGESWLLHRGGRLTEAEALLTRGDYARRLGERGRAYLEASRAREDAATAEGQARRERERRHLERQRRLQRGIGALIGVLAVLTAAFASFTIMRARETGAQVSLVLTDAAQRSIADRHYTRAARLAILASRSGWLSAVDPAAEPTLGAAAAQSRLDFAVPAHEGAVRGLRISPDGHLWLTWGQDERARLWRAGNGKLLAEWRHRDGIVDASFSPDGDYLLSCGYDRRIEVRSGVTGGALATLEVAEDLSSAVFSPDGTRLLTWGEQAPVRVLKAPSGREITRCTPSDEMSFEGARFSPDGQRVLAWGIQGAALFDAASGRELARPPGSFLVDGLFAGEHHLLGLGQAAAWWFDLKSGAGAQVASISTSGAAVAAADDEGVYLIYGDSAPTTRLWTSAGGDRELGAGLPAGALFSADRQRAFWWSDHAWRSIRTSDGDERGGGPAQAIAGAAFAPDGRRLLLWAADGELSLQDPDGGELEPRFRSEGRPVGAAFAGNGRAVVWDEEGVLSVGSLADHSMEEFAAGQLPADLLPVAVPSGLAQDERGRPIVPGAASRAAIHGPVAGAVRSPDGGRVAFWDEAGKLFTGNAAGGSPPRALAAAAVQGAAFDPAGVSLLAWDPAGWQLFEAATGKLVDRRETIAIPGGAAFSPAGDRVLVWDQAGGGRLFRRSAPDAPLAEVRRLDNMWNATFSPEGRRLLSYTFGGVVLHDAETGTVLLTRDHDGAGVERAAFTTDGRQVLISRPDGSAYLWNVGWTQPRQRAGELAAQVCAAILRGPEVPLAEPFVNGRGERISARSVRRISAGDAAAAPLLRDRIGEDVCAGAPD